MKIYTVTVDGRAEDGALVGRGGRHLYSSMYGVPFDRESPPVVKAGRIYGCALMSGKPEFIGGPQIFLGSGGSSLGGALVLVQHSHQDHKWGSFKGRHVNLARGLDEGESWCVLQIVPETAVCIEQTEAKFVEKHLWRFKWTRFVKLVHHYRVVYLPKEGELVVFPSHEQWAEFFGKHK